MVLFSEQTFLLPPTPEMIKIHQVLGWDGNKEAHKPRFGVLGIICNVHVTQSGFLAAAHLSLWPRDLAQIKHFLEKMPRKSPQFGDQTMF